MSAVVRRATRLSGTFAVLTGGSNDDLHKTCKCNARSCAARRARGARKPTPCATFTGFGAWWCVLPRNTVYIFSYFYFFFILY